MQDNRKLIVRKAKDGVNYEAVIQDYCGDYYDRVVATAGTKYDALKELETSLKIDIFNAQRDLEFLNDMLYLNYCKHGELVF